MCSWHLCNDKWCFLSVKGVYIVLNRSWTWILTPGFNQSSRGESGKYSSPVCLSVWLVGVCYSLSVSGLWLVVVVSFLVMDPNPKSGYDLDPDKPVCAKSCRRDVTNPVFSHSFFVFFVPDFCNQSRLQVQFKWNSPIMYGQQQLLSTENFILEPSFVH